MHPEWGGKPDPSIGRGQIDGSKKLYQQLHVWTARTNKFLTFIHLSKKVQKQQFGIKVCETRQDSDKP